MINTSHTILGEIVPEHWHIDFVYYAKANPYELRPEKGESKLLKWYTRDELSNSENIFKMANEALDLLVEN